MTATGIAVSAGGRRASTGVWVVLLLLAAGIVLLAFVGQDDATLGGRADPEGTGREGLAALRIMIEETGGTVTLGAHAPAADHDVAILATDAYSIAALFIEAEASPSAGEDEEGAIGDVTATGDALAEVFAPILDWVEGGGRLVTGVDVPGGPQLAFAQNDEGSVGRGACSIGELSGVSSVSMPDHIALEVGSGDRSCFGDDAEAVVVARPVGTGEILRVGSFEPLFNRRLDEPDNGALAARVIGMGAAPAVVFLSGPDPAAVGGAGGPVDDEGNPIGAGDSGLFDLVPSKVIALLIGLAGAALLYALAVGRRLGSPVEEPLPIELPSSSYTEAVGRLYARAEQPRARSARALRHDFRATAARRVGMSAAAPDRDLATALTITTGADPDRLVGLLEGPDPATDDDFVRLAAHLAEQRNLLRRGAAAAVERNPNDRPPA